jgi:hypothetical protein
MPRVQEDKPQTEKIFTRKNISGKNYYPRHTGNSLDSKIRKVTMHWMGLFNNRKK